ncbi:MAG: molecular chaperone HtpG [Acholeplasmatales bacterium]|jgi:molecular chaperone HtpG|nr:molecular chaperone HtpG [Acholeplasmatales bacterium]
MKQFKAESKKLLDILINSIYTHKEVFVRELISNSSDAIDKLYYKSLNENLNLPLEEFRIDIKLDKEKRTITISDNGIGMDDKELETNLGTLAKSDTENFKKEIKDNNLNVIGKFGVGFYSAFMVAKHVDFISLKYGLETAYIWSSDGIEGFTIKETSREINGSTVVLTLKDDDENNKYSDYLDESNVKELIKKYSDFIRYPIKMNVLKTSDSKEKEEVENITLNSMTPPWKKSKTELKENELEEYYENEFYDYEKPISTILTKAEGNVNYQALLFIPGVAPYDYYYKSFEKGLKLYTNSVLIMEKCKELISDTFSFVRGVVETDVDLNISRETIQHNHLLSKISQSLDKKIKQELVSLLEEKREDYEKFYKAFGLKLKWSCYENFGSKKDLVEDLLLFYSLKHDKYITLKEYTGAIATDEKNIYYVVSKSKDQAKLIPQADYQLEKGNDILLFSDEVDEFLVKILGNFEEKNFKSITDSDFSSNSDGETEDEKSLLASIKEFLKDEIAEVKLSTDLKENPVCLTSKGDISIEMEKVLNSQPNSNQVSSVKVLEINKNHLIFKKLESIKDDALQLENYSKVLLDFAKLIAGLNIGSPSKLAIAVANLLSK